MSARRSRPYNTGLGGAELASLRAGLGDIDNAASAKGVVFAHRVEAAFTPGQAALVAGAACLYCELPWAGGWQRFHDRAGVAPAGSHDEYIAAVRRLIEGLRKPAFIVCAKRDALRLSHHAPQPITLNRQPAWLAADYVETVPAAASTAELLAGLAALYPSVYDFGCGYGNALRPFRYFVGSDIDRKCLDYIARELL